MTDDELDLVETERLVSAICRRMHAKGGLAVVSLAFRTDTDHGDVYHSFERSAAALAVAQCLTRNIEAALRGEELTGWRGIEDR